MTTEKMSVHKALCELKTLDSRIASKRNSVKFVFANKHGNTKINGLPIADVCAEIKEAYQSVTDLMERRSAIKRAVVLSNASTKINVGGKEYTVAEAIEMKNNGIPMQRELLAKLSVDNERARRDAESANGERLEERASDYIRSLYGNSTDLRGMSEEMKKTKDDFITAQTVEIVDPIKASDEIARLNDEINKFVVDIDSALSVSNALTEIEVVY